MHCDTGRRRVELRRDGVQQCHTMACCGAKSRRVLGRDRATRDTFVANVLRVHGRPLIDALHARAARHGRIVSAAELTASGVTRGQIEALLRAGHLTRVLRPGTFVIGPPTLTVEESWAAALRAVDRIPGRPDAARLSHISACEVRELLAPRTSVVHVTTPRLALGGTRRFLVPTVMLGRPRHLELRVHRMAGAAGLELCAGFPTALLARSLVDLAGHAPPKTVARAWDEAEYRGMLELEEVERELARRRAPGVVQIRRLLAQSRPYALPGDAAASRAEQTLARLLTGLPLPTPALNPSLRLPGGERFQPDLLWFEVGLAVEVDGPHHRLPRRATGDEDRALRLFAAGIDVIRLSTGRITSVPATCQQQVVAAYRRQAARATPELGETLRQLRIE